MRFVAALAALLSLALLLIQVRMGLFSSIPPAAAIVDAPQQFDGGAHCYLGAFATVARRAEPDLTYETIMRYANPGRVDSGSQVLGNAALLLGYRIEVSAMYPWARRGQLRLLGGAARVATVHDGKEEAFQALQAQVAQGIVPVVNVDLYYLIDELRKAWPGMSDHGHAPHFLAVVGYDWEHVYLHDSQIPTPLSGPIGVRRAAFLQAWEARGGVLFTFRREGERIGQDAAYAAAVQAAASAGAYLRKLARKASRRPLDLGEMPPMPAVPFRRRVWAQWLKERGETAAAERYQALARRYHAGRPHMTVAEGIEELKALADQEDEAAGLIRSHSVALP